MQSVKETGTGATSIEFVCECGNRWEARAYWEGERVILEDPAAERCGNCGRDGDPA